MPRKCECGKRYFMQESENKCPACRKKPCKIETDGNGCYLVEQKELFFKCSICKKVIGDHEHYFVLTSNHPENNGEVISVQALGEWAIKTYIWYLKQSKEIEKKYKTSSGSYIFTMSGGINEMLSRAATYHEIAISCLGEKEIKKRLEGN